MKVLLINGSPRKNGNTFTALYAIAQELNNEGIETEIAWIGTQPIRGCIGCGKCKNNRCIFDEDITNKILQKAEGCDGYIFGSPVYYASANGSLICLMDRMFYAGSSLFKYKPAANIVSARRAGTTAAYDQLNKYIGISSMISVPAPYWNMVHGSLEGECVKDAEGMYIMKSIGANMAWLLKVLESGKKQAGDFPRSIERASTNFIR